MDAALPVLTAHPHFEAVGSYPIAVAAARTAGAAVVNPQPDPTQGTGALDHVPDRRFRLTAQGIWHG